MSGTVYQPLDILSEHGIASNDLQKLQNAGYHTVESVRGTKLLIKIWSSVVNRAVLWKTPWHIKTFIAYTIHWLVWFQFRFSFNLVLQSKQHNIPATGLVTKPTSVSPIFLSSETHRLPMLRPASYRMSRESPRLRSQNWRKSSRIWSRWNSRPQQTP